MVKQYPHTINYVPVTNSTQDESGNWVGSSPGAPVSAPCRAEPSSGNGYIVSQSGSRIDYSWIVYLPLGTAPIPEGSSVTVKNGNLIIASDTVKRFHKGQLNARIWL